MNRDTLLEKSSARRSSRTFFSKLGLGLGRVCALSLCCLALVACDSDEDNKEANGGEMGGGGVMGGAEVGGGDGGASGGVMVEQGELFLTYTRIVTEGSDTRGDLLAFQMRTQTELWLNEGMSREDLDCVTFGCKLHPNLDYVAWIKREGTNGALWLAPIDKEAKRVNIEQKRMISEVALGFSFSDSKLHYTEVKDPNARLGIAVKSAPLVEGDVVEHDLVDNNGGLSVGRNDDLLVIIKTTLSSMNLTLRNLANGMILDLITFGEEGGTGSPFAATSNPVNISPLEDYISIVTSNDFIWRLHTLPLSGDDMLVLDSRDLFPVQSSEDACSAELPFTQVLGAPKMSPDGERLYLLFGGDCSQRENPTSNRRDYDIYRFRRDLSADPLNVTRIIAYNGWSNHDIGSFDVTPDESKVAFTATRPNQSGVKAIWLQEVSEGEGEDQTVFDCSRDPNVSPQIDINMQRRCEFIVYEGSAASVEYRSLNFVSAGGL